MKRKVLICLDHLELGGAERQALHLAEYLHSKDNYEVMVIGFRQPEGQVANVLKTIGVPLEVVKMSLYTRKRVILSNCVKVWRVLMRIKPEVVIPFTYWPNLFCGMVWKFTGTKMCIWNQRDGGVGVIGRPFEKFALHYVTAVVSNSLEGKIFLGSTFGLKDDDIKVIHNGVQLKAPKKTASQWRHDLSLEGNHFVAIMLANLHRNKDHTTLVKAWRIVVDGAQKPFPILVLAGRRDVMYESLRDLVTNLRLEDNIKFLGSVEDTPGLLAISNLGVFSSKKEGLPNGIIECMAAGLPVVATNITGATEALGVNYEYLASPGNPQEFAQKILRLYNDPGLRQKIGQRNRQMAESEFGIHKMLEAYSELIVSNHIHT